MPLPLALGIASAAMPLVKAGFGAIGNINSKKRLNELEGEKVNISTPSSIQQYVDAPISEKYLQQIADQASQRVGTSVNALQKGGLAAMGKIPSLMQNEARNDAALQADLGDREKQALLTGGQYESRTQDAARRDWEQQMQGEQMRRADMMKYIMGGLGEAGGNVLAANYAGAFDGLFGGGGNGTTEFKMGTTPYSGGATEPRLKPEPKPKYDNSVPLFSFVNK